MVIEKCGQDVCLKILYRRQEKLRAVKTLGKPAYEPTLLSLRQGTRRRCFYLTQFPLPVLHFFGIHLNRFLKNGVGHYSVTDTLRLLLCKNCFNCTPTTNMRLPNC